MPKWKWRGFRWPPWMCAVTMPTKTTWWSPGSSQQWRAAAKSWDTTSTGSSSINGRLTHSLWYLVHILTDTTTPLLAKPPSYLVTASMDCVWQVRGGHAPLGPVQWRPGEVRPLPGHRLGGGAVLRVQGAGPEQGGCEPGFPRVRGCGCHGSVRQSSPQRWRATPEPSAATWS